MFTRVDADLLTIAEAARLLRVSAVTLQRWLKQGRLPAYRLGPRRLRIRRQDLSKILVPVSREDVEAAEEMPPQETHQVSAEEGVLRRLEAIKRSEALVARMRARKGGQPLPSSWELIREAREERSKRL